MVVCDLLGRQMTVIVDDRQLGGELVVQLARELGFEQEIRVYERGRRHWFTPLARNPPSTTSTSPLTKLQASVAKNTQAAVNSSLVPKRWSGVRIRNSRPRAVPSSKL